MLGGYESDWTRRRYSEAEGKSEICTELATTLSKSTSAAAQQPKVRRLSFARHASVIESTTGPSQPALIPLISKTLNFRHQPSPDQETPPSFKELTGGKPRSGSYSSTEEITSEHESNVSLEVQSILDGSSKKPFHMANFECFLQDSKKLEPLEETNPWLIHASVMVAFLLEFRSYAEMFARIPAHEKTASPHPFDIICIINSGLPHNPSHPSLAHTRNDERRACFDEYYNNHSDLINDYPALDTNNPPKHFPPRKVNWAASVRSYSSDRLVEPTSISQPHPSRARRAVSVSCSNISSAVSSVLPDGLNPESQPMRPVFDALIQKYLGSRKAWDQAGGLLSQFDELKSDLMTRALLEAKYTNHPAVLAGLVDFILEGLNQHVIPIFMEKTSGHSKKNKGIIAMRMVAGLMILLSATVLELILILVPSPLAKALELRTIPRWFRLAFLPLFVISTLLICMDQFNICCFTFWSVKSGCVSCISRRKIQQIGGKLGQSEKQSLDNMEENLLGKSRSSEPQKDHQMKKNACWWILTSLVLTLILQTTFLVLPATQPKEK